MLKIALLMNILSLSAMADSEIDRCGSLADRKLKTVYQAVAFPVDYIQWNLVDRIERTDFQNTTPGSMDQEYTATYRVTYQRAPYAYFEEQTLHVEYQSPFACDDLKLKCVQVLSSKVAAGVDPSLLAKSGPLTCGF